MTAMLEQRNALAVPEPEMPEPEAEYEIVYTSPHIHDGDDVQLEFRRLEAIRYFPWATPCGWC